MNCTVCASNVLFKGFERKDPRSSASHIRDLGERGVSDIAFADDALLLDSERYAVPFFEALIADGNAVRLHTPNGLHVREITPELARLMKRAGVVTIRLSLETSNRERQADFSHKVKREDFRRAVKALYEAGYSPKDLGAYILAGMPGQEHGEVLDTIQFAWDAGVTVKPALFSPVPGTVAFDRAVDAGMIRRDGDPVLQNNTLRTTDWFKGGETEYRAFRTRITLGNERVG